MTLTLSQIQAAAGIIDGTVVRTPTVRSAVLSHALGLDVFFKLETLQYTGSFKDRGALVKLSSLTPEQRQKGIIAVSAGNHAQGVAYHAQRLQIPATIVMPKTTPFTKVNRTEEFGARVLLHGATISDTMPFAEEAMRDGDLTFVHPFDDVHIMAGQGTVGMEILEDVPDVEAVIAPIGGGGLIAGIATALKALKPDVEILGVEATQYPSMYQSLQGTEVHVGGETIAEGIAVKEPGSLTLPIVRACVDEVFLADELALEEAVQEMLVTAKILAEGAGAAPFAALTANLDRFKGKKVVLIASGSNIDSRILASVLMRGLVRDGRMVRLRVTISDAPGTLAKVAEQIGGLGGNIVEIVHQRLFFDVPVKRAEADIVVETRDTAHVEEIIAQLQSAGFPTRWLGNSALTG